MTTLDSLQGTWVQKEDSRYKIEFKENVMLIYYLNESTKSNNKFYLTTYPLHKSSEIKSDMKDGHFLSVAIDSPDGTLLKYSIDYISSSKLVLFFGRKEGGPFTYYKQKLRN